MISNPEVESEAAISSIRQPGRMTKVICSGVASCSSCAMSTIDIAVLSW